MAVTITDIEPGMVINYRGAPATVALVWKSETDPRARGIRDPMGMEIEWTDEEGRAQRTRLVWPELDTGEQAQMEALAPDERSAALAQRLAQDIAARTFETWPE